MSKLDLTTALGRLLTNALLRSEFKRSPRDTAARLTLRDEDLESFLALDPADLEVQAKTLLHKRYGEVSRLIPLSLARLESAAWSLFEAYSLTGWPEGPQRHLQDAAGFAEYLNRLGHVVAKAEIHRLRFILRENRFSACWVRDLLIRGRHHPGVQVLYRSGGQVHALALYLRV